MGRSFRESIKALEADIDHANTLASGYRRERDGACFQMRLSYSPSAHLFLFLVQWADCQLAGALGLLRILVYMTYADGKTTMSVYERKASIRQFYGYGYWRAKETRGGKRCDISFSCCNCKEELQNWRIENKRNCAVKRYRRTDMSERSEFMKLEEEIEEECGICMEINNKVVLPNCCHSLCFKCYQDWSSRSQSCPFCRDCLAQVKPGDLWIYTDDHDIVDLSVITMENVSRLFIYLDKLPLMDPYGDSMSYDWHIG